MAYKKSYKKELTQAEIEAREQEKKQRRSLYSTITKMSEQERIDLMNEVVLLTTCEGHTLTLNNTAFILEQLSILQSPLVPTVIGGFQQWLKEERIVKKGEKAFYMLVPCNTKKEGSEVSDNEPKMFFIEKPMFDITQTITFEESEALKKQA